MADPNNHYTVSPLYLAKIPTVSIMPPTNPPLHPTMWAISYSQLMNFHEEAATHFGQSYPNMAMRDINAQIISPVCRSTGSSYALHLNPKGLKIDAFVTHAWDEPFGDFVESIREALKPLVSKPNLWICSFALVQGSEDTVQNQMGQEDTPLTKSPFVRALQEASSYLVVRNTKTDIYSRIWCVAEVIYANKMGLIPERTFVAGPDNFSHIGASVLSANATRQEDKARILRLLLNDYNYHEIDDIVNMFRMQEGRKLERDNIESDRRKPRTVNIIYLILALAALLAVVTVSVLFFHVFDSEESAEPGGSSAPSGFLRPPQAPSLGQPTIAPSLYPSISPVESLTNDPSTHPSNKSSVAPTVPLTNSPTTTPTKLPSILPTVEPSNVPTSIRTQVPTETLTNDPSTHPSNKPSVAPTVPLKDSSTTTPTKLPSSLPTSKTTDFPTNVPAPKSRIEETKALLISKGIADKSRLETLGVPENLAMTWIADIDGLKIPINDVFFIQRYLLVLFYYSTNGQTEWTNKEQWLSDSTECEWFGINKDHGGCESGRAIRSIELDINGLKGTLPSELFLLTELVTINFDSNCLRGTIPQEITSLTKLEKLWMDRNVLDGEVPEGLWSMTSLNSLSLYYNRLKGDKIPLDSGVCQKQPNDIFVTVDCVLCPDWNTITDGGPCCDNCWVDWFYNPKC